MLGVCYINFKTYLHSKDRQNWYNQYKKLHKTRPFPSQHLVCLAQQCRMYSYFKSWRKSAFHCSVLPDATLPLFKFFLVLVFVRQWKLSIYQAEATYLKLKSKNSIGLPKAQLHPESQSFTTNKQKRKEGISQVCTSFIEQWVKRSHELILLEACELVCYNAKFIYKSQFSTSCKLSESKTLPNAT